MKKILIAVLVLATVVFVFIKAREKSADKQPDAPKFVYCAPNFDTSALNKGDAPLLEGLGKWDYKVTTSSERAALFFNQGLALMYAFNHGESARSFRTAIRLDSNFAMAYWGVAMVLGPNYNAALNPTQLSDINYAVDKAVSLASRTKPHEQALIGALSKRFPREETSELTPYYEAYAAEMEKAHKTFPEDAEIATLYADALMNIHPWDLWAKDGTPKPWTENIIRLLETTLNKWPNHPGAIHYYIHATEASKDTRKVVPYADVLSVAMPAAGHMVHMPAHIYIRTGEYHKGLLTTENATVADSSYVAQCNVQGVYPLMYYPHNIHFQAACAFFEGNSKKAMDAAWMVSRKADRKFLPENITVQHFYMIPYYVMVHFGMWDEIMKQRHPGEELKYPSAVWHYARGMAFAAQGNLERAEAESAALEQFAKDETMRSQLIWDMNSVLDVIQIANYTLKGEILGHKKNYEEAIPLFRKAIELEDALVYTEPPDWFFSVRQTLGHWLVEAGKYQDAEKTYLEDLDMYKENGWSLIGLHRALKAQGRETEAADVKSRFQKAWQWSDVSLASSRKF